eukprot:s2357_g22.t1
MDRDELEDCMWQTLCRCGLTGKKLAVYSVNDAEEITVQLCKKLGIVCELWHVDLVSTWINDAVRSEPVAKRLRGDATLDPLDSKILEERINLGSQLSSSSSSSAVLVSVLPDSRPSRRRAQDGGEEHARKLRDDQQKEMWSRELYLELKKIEAPALEHLEHCVNDRHLHMALAGRTRYNTLKRYVKTWMAFMQWLNAAKNVVEYPVPGDLVEYLFARYDEPCGPSIPVLIVKAVTWFEKVACLDVRARIGESHVVSSVRDYIVEMLSKDSAPTKRAPRYPAVFLEALEAMVDNESLVLGMRLIAWIKLVKIWASLRWDDVQKIIPKELKYYAGRMTTVLRITKTSGPTKRIQELPVCVSERSFVTSPFWLKTGFDLFKEHASFERDYLLPKLNKEWSGFRRSMALYNDISSYSAYVRKAAKRPGTSVSLIDAALATFWTEHSERATVPTGLALLRVHKDERDMLGRWKPDGSDTYIRMYNGVVSRLQHQFAKAIRTPNRTSLLDERDIVESAHSWLVERCEQIPEDQLLGILSHLEESLGWQVQPGWDVAGEVEEAEADEVEEMDASPPEQVNTWTAAHKEERKPMYVVVETGRKCRRLHKSRGGCWMGREMTFKTSTEYYQMPDETAYTHVCKVCWPRDKPTDTVEDSSSSSSTSSSDSVSSSDDQESRVG